MGLSTTDNSHLYIGTMSGTSADGLDIALCEINSISDVRLIKSYSTPYPDEIKHTIKHLQLLTADELFNSHKNELAELDTRIAKFYALHINTFLDNENIPSDSIAAIGNHGQTILHQPKAQRPFSLQIGNAQIVAQATHINVVADFRTADISAGGEGAPLIPAFHHAIFQQHAPCSIVNIGGISNISYIEKESDKVTGYDIGPGNTLMDQWIKQHKGADFDRDGLWAKTGKVNEELLQKLLNEPYFSVNAPKSTGQDLFNIIWLNQYIDENIKPNDIQRTLLELTAMTLADAIQKDDKPYNPIYLCGGGALNSFLVERIKQLTKPTTVSSTLDLGLDPQNIEAMGFAWLAYCKLNNIESNLPAVTGANKKVCLGRLFKFDN